MNNNVIRKTGYRYWLMTPASNEINFLDKLKGSYSRLVLVNENGEFEFSNPQFHPSWSSTGSNESCGYRPAISLIPGIQFTSGDGSKDNPYVVNTSGFS